MTQNPVCLQRIYDEPNENGGCRVLVDGLWPRGISKDKSGLDLWLREIAPSKDLRRWFNHDVSRWEEFRSRYEDELGQPERQQALEKLKTLRKTHSLTLLYAARDRDHNNAVVLKDVLDR